MKNKLRFVFLPFLLTLIVLLIGYTFLHWLLFIVVDIFSLKEIVTNFGIPIILAGLAAWVFFRSKLKVLKLESNGGRTRDFYSFMIWLLLSVPLIIAQEYITTASGRITTLHSVNDISKTTATKYYKIDLYYIDKSFTGRFPSFDVSGKHNENFNMHLYFAVPIFEKAADTLANGVSAWLGVKYIKTISNRLEPQEKEAMYKNFVFDSKEDFAKLNLSGYLYFDRVGYSDDRDGYISAIANNGIYSPNENILKGVKEPFEKRNGKTVPWLLGTSVGGLILWLIMVLIPGIDKKQLMRMKAGRPDRITLRERKEFIELLKPKDWNFITLIILYLNIGIYLLMVLIGYGFIQFNAQDLLHIGANFGPATRSGEWWRLLTCIFLHGGLMHLLANMYGLMFVGLFLEPLLGTIKYLGIYLITGIIASATSIWWYPAIVSVGASGAIFGLYGVFIALMLRKIFPKEFAQSFLVSTSVFVGFNLLMGLTGGIDNAAHIGGLISGFIIGMVIKVRADAEGRMRKAKGR
ncbi:MAG: rhomboid family intramembrane serine protease [Agriterribacter sp.]